MSVEFRLLGPVQVLRDETPVMLPPGKPRALFAALLLSANTVVSLEQLQEALWASCPPRSAVANLRTYVRGLRLALADPETAARLVSHRNGYRLRVEPGEFDVWLFDRAVDQARRAMDSGDVAGAGSLLEQALHLWRGPAGQDVRLGAVMGSELASLDEARLSVEEQYAEARLAEGDAEHLAGRLRTVLASNPLRERAWRLLMTAQYRSGDVAGALETYRTARTVLIEHLGVEPGAELSDLQRRILGREELAVVRAPAMHPAIRQLPPAPASFVGRTGELARIKELLDPSHGRTPVVAVFGSGGVGKSALALQAAHDVAEWFPDGQLYVALRGAGRDGEPRGVRQVIARLLRALQPPGGAIPAEPEEAAAALRSMLAARRMLLLLDDAADAAQVAPLLAAGPGCATLVTSRSPLVGLDQASLLRVGVLPHSEAVALLAALTGSPAQGGGDQQLDRVADLCGRLPLALRIAAALIVVRPGWTVSDLADRLTDERYRLDELTVGDLAVRTTFEVSYRALAQSSADTESRAALAFQLVGLLGIPEPSAVLIAAGLDESLTDVAVALERLTDVQLLEAVAPGRYGCHELLRIFAADLAAAADAETRQLSLRRAWSSLLGPALRALRLLRPGQVLLVEVDPELLHAASAALVALPDRAAAVRWLDENHSSLVAAAGQAAAGPLALTGFAVHLLQAASLYLSRNGLWLELGSLATSALAAADRGRCSSGRAFALTKLALVDLRTGELERAEDRLHRSIGTWQELGSAEGEADALSHLGLLQYHRGQHQQALDSYERSLPLHRNAGESAAVGVALNNMGVLHFQLGRAHTSLSLLADALVVRERLGDHAGAAVTHAELAMVLCALGQYDEASRHVAAGLTASQETGNREVEATLHLVWAEVMLRTDRPGRAADVLSRGLALTRQLVDRYGEVVALRQLARVHRGLGAHSDADRCEREAADVMIAYHPVPDPALATLLSAAP